MKRLGCTLVLLGLGALILPLGGLQFIIVDALSDSGTSTWQISLLLILVGTILLLANNSPRQDTTNFRSSSKSAGTLLRSDATDVDQAMQQFTPMIQSAASDIMAITRDALVKGVPPETVVDVLISKMRLSKNDAQTIVSNLLKEILRETDIKKPAGISNTKTDFQKH